MGEREGSSTIPPASGFLIDKCVTVCRHFHSDSVDERVEPVRVPAQPAHTGAFADLVCAGDQNLCAVVRTMASCVRGPKVDTRVK